MGRSRDKQESLGRVRSKADLPTKICVVCQRPFTWRKKWEDCWDEVKYCSERCRRHRSQAAGHSETEKPKTQD
ncbi:MAG TPA: DUF2256 domain-containing protein [Coleofasciculaceae cyanobacterium]